MKQRLLDNEARLQVATQLLAAQLVAAGRVRDDRQDRDMVYRSVVLADMLAEACVAIPHAQQEKAPC